MYIKYNKIYTYKEKGTKYPRMQNKNDRLKLITMKQISIEL